MPTRSAPRRRSLFAPEVIQTSAMDCGPAALKCVLEGHGIHVSYGRLREACQTGIDGTSIDTLEEIAGELGIDAQQLIVPLDHVFEPAARALPALLVVRQPGGSNHFLVVWSCHGDLVQLMDPGTGRRWTQRRRLLDSAYLHSQRTPAAAWREWASSPEFVEALRARCVKIGCGELGATLVAEALAEPGWRALAALDAAVRMVHGMVRAGAIARGRPAAGILVAVFARARVEDLAHPTAHQTIPRLFWSVRPAPADEDGEEALMLRGAVLVSFRGLRGAPADDGLPAGAVVRSPELAEALREPPARPGRALLGLLRLDGLGAPALLLVGLALASVCVLLEAVALRSALDVGAWLGLPEQRAAAWGLLVALLLIVLAVEVPLAAAVLRMGRALEARLRIAFLRKIPRLEDRYLQSRPTSDMAERSHGVHRLRLIPGVAAQLLRGGLELALVTAGLVWLDPDCVRLALPIAAATVLLPLAFQPLLGERDMRVRSHAGALSRFYLDALLGLTAIRTHGAERTVRREHEGLLVEWAHTSRALLAVVVAVEAMQTLTGVGLVAWLFFDHVQRVSGGASTLLFLYWALSLPVLGQEIAAALRQVPAHRNVTLRLLEPLGAREVPSTASAGEVRPRPAAVGLRFAGVGVVAGGHALLAEVDLQLRPGEHVAIIGPSGAGKSTLLGLLLGWHHPAQGQVLVDDEPLRGEVLERLRTWTAWVDPGVRLWNRSLLDNLRYGARADMEATALARAFADADLRDLLAELPEGLQTALGEGGALLSGGEGQRVRLGRALAREQPALVLLDEPFRGLDRPRRQRLLTRVRARWRSSTLLCVTHDVGEAVGFDRVLVVEGGRVVEDGPPDLLAAQPDSRYSALVAAEAELREELWANPAWRHLRLIGGAVRGPQEGPSE
ncbi:ATP-binding cassette domain-containing protein [Nannocystis radixulma]|uniref:ATP-binding cassette domain-containing protein n=1 Tax=Nannocystis radixulma TaxID=2995305 RepID=A0ABT5BLT8_9BACT|nr:ATP-binding cassette domain-containing protein [Nannocystis radixulma]MDC0674545.1 ATP-binding cassette domain-containing protein [Nannocystis radixulma]